MTVGTTRSHGLSASPEDCLEAISVTVAKNRAARAIDIAKRVNIAGPSVTSVLHSLAERGLVNRQ